VNGIPTSHFSQTTGLWSSPLTISPRTRKRSYAANVGDIRPLTPVASSSPRLKMYYEPHASRSNLIVLTSAHVTRISLSKAGGGEATAESVSFLYEGNEYRAHVKKEVIVSAG
jgi:choline dehydrogenase-like flavoprotein